MWYSNVPQAKLLSPLSWIFSNLVATRRASYAGGKKQVWRAPVPVCIVGNITVGGTGKTPLVIWLTHWLQSRGRKVGIVSGGYGGRSKRYPLCVEPSTSSYEAGDEPIVLVKRTGAPVVVDPNRVVAVQKLLDLHDVDIVISDDGLQHYALGRDLEVVVIDGLRGIGNGMMLPAGPLREPVERLGTVDWIVSNSCASRVCDAAWVMRVVAGDFVNVRTEQRRLTETFLNEHGRVVHVAAAIGNPARFQATLDELGFVPRMNVYPDHHAFRRRDLAKIPAGPIVVTEKDAQRIRPLPDLAQRCWFLEIDVQFDPGVDEHLEALFNTKGLALRNSSG